MGCQVQAELLLRDYLQTIGRLKVHDWYNDLSTPRQRILEMAYQMGVEGVAGLWQHDCSATARGLRDSGVRGAG